MRSLILSSTPRDWDDASTVRFEGPRVSSHGFLNLQPRYFQGSGNVLCGSSDIRSSIQSKRITCSSWRLLTTAVGRDIGPGA